MYKAPVEQLRVYLSNPLSFRGFTLPACVQLMAKFCSLSGGYSESLGTVGLGVYMTAAAGVAEGATVEERQAVEQRNSERPILYVLLMCARVRDANVH